MTELAVRIIPRLSKDERRVMAKAAVQLAMLGGYKGITIEQHDKVRADTIKSLIARGLARTKIDNKSRVMLLTSLGEQVNEAIADRHSKSGDAQQAPSRSDESGGAGTAIAQRRVA